MPRIHVHVTGIVQGVGYRPFVWKLATQLGLVGWVRNASDGVHIEAKGDQPALDSFVLKLSTQRPSAARVDTIHVDKLVGERVSSPATTLTSGVDGHTAESDFRIVSSDAECDRTALVSPDIATCPDCLTELADKNNRRYHYPFINCTNCGPRFTITSSLPYDRKNTSMAGFEMCDDCAEEYGNPADRRFHAQPDACFECGPHLSWRTAEDPGHVVWGTDLKTSDEIIERAAYMLLRGQIVAVKGLGGYHLACDATNEDAVRRLRERKRRPTKPLAVMFGTLDKLRRVAYVNAAERAALIGSVRPICLVRRKPDNEVPEKLRIARSVAGELPEIGAMLPYTPLQHLLLTSVGVPLVMTSGNLADEPIICDDQIAVARLMDVADAWLGNDRPILARYDDSVIRVVGKQVTTVRRARGMAPTPVEFCEPPLTNALMSLGVREANLPVGDAARLPEVAACGSEQKSTFTITRGATAFVSQHIGDLENAESFEAWQQDFSQYRQLFDLTYSALACDMHPEYLISKWAREEAEKTGTRLFEVQHHHAHIAAVLAENGVWDQVAGVALDGTGYGPDGTIWGGEVLACDQADYVRAAHIATWPLPGGAAAIRKPLRCAFGLLWACGMGESEAAERLVERMGIEGPVTRQMIIRDLNCPLTSSAGRLFDAVAALIGIVDEAGYDGEPACLLEAAAYTAEEEDEPDPRYVLELRPANPDEAVDEQDVSLVLDPKPMVQAILDDLDAGVEPAVIARRFHTGFTDSFARAAAGVARASGLTGIALGGGVFCNRIVFERMQDDLVQAGFTVYTPRQLPVNDGAVSYGQAAVARARLAQEYVEANAPQKKG